MTPIHKFIIDDFPFNVSVTNITVLGLNRIKANVTLSHTGKLACILADANYTNEELDYLDGDEAGRKGNTKIANFLINNKRKVFVAYIPDYKDVNDMTEDEFINMEVESYYTWKIDIDKRLNNKN